MKGFRTGGSLLFLLAALNSCGSVLTETRTSVDAMATAINEDFLLLRRAEESIVLKVAALYEREGTLDLSTKGMDASEGGLYATFPGNKYYYKKEARGSALYLSPGKPVTDAMRRQVKFLEYVDPILQKESEASEIRATTFYGFKDPVNMALLNPWFDVVSLLPPGIDLSVFEWYNRGLQSSGSPVWSVKPFTDLAYGWVMDVSAPVRQGGRIRGVSVISADLQKLALKYFQGKNSNLFLMGSDSTVVGMGKEASKILGISALESVDYLKQVKENTFAPGKFLLSDATQPLSIRTLAQGLLAGKPSFSAEIQGKSYTVVQQIIPENKMVVVGLSPR